MPARRTRRTPWFSGQICHPAGACGSGTALTEWTFGPEQAAAIGCPVLSVRGTDTRPLWSEVAGFLRAALPDVEDHLQRPRPVAHAIADFLAGNPMTGH